MHPGLGCIYDGMQYLADRGEVLCLDVEFCPVDILDDGHEGVHRAEHHEVLVRTEKGFEPFDGVPQ